MPIEVEISTIGRSEKIFMAERKKYFTGAGTAAYERNNAYQKEHYKRLNIVLKPELLDQINQAAKDAGQSKNGWIIEAIKCKLKGLY